jgi:hypothetical protein
MSGAEVDPFESPEFREWAAEVEAELVPKMAGSAAAITLWTGGVDVKLAVETGLAVLMGKPIIVAVIPGATVPDKLLQLADAVIELDPANPERFADRLHEALGRLLEEGGR